MADESEQRSDETTEDWEARNRAAAEASVRGDTDEVPPAVPAEVPPAADEDGWGQ